MMINIEELVTDYMTIKEQNVKLKEAIRFYEELLNTALKQDDVKIVRIGDRMILSTNLFNKLMNTQNHSFTVVKKGEYNISKDNCQNGNNDSTECYSCSHDETKESHCHSCHNCHNCHDKCSQHQDHASPNADCFYAKTLKEKLERERKNSYSKDSIIRFTPEN